MSYEMCPRCKQYNYTPCKCVPFLVYYPEYFGDEKEEYYGQDFKDVVERIAKMLNEDEPVFDRNLFETPIEITDQNGVTKRFNCTAFISVDYYVKEEEAAEQLLQPENGPRYCTNRNCAGWATDMCANPGKCLDGAVSG